jgi:long-subunit fatty acid transport protein
MEHKVSTDSVVRALLVIILIFIAFSLALNVLQFAMESAARTERAMAAEEIMKNYNQAAYEDSDVDTIYQQQLIASESILLMLQNIAEK